MASNFLSNSFFHYLCGNEGTVQQLLKLFNLKGTEIIDRYNIKKIKLPEKRILELFRRNVSRITVDTIIESFGNTFVNGKINTYDMTFYIDNQDLRFRDSQLVARFFDSLWAKFKVDNSRKDINYRNIKFSEVFHGTRRCFQFLKTPQEIFDYYFTLEQIEKPNSVNEILNTSIQIVVPFFSFVKSQIHSLIDILPPISYCYSELDTIVGYPVQENRALVDDPKEWLEKDVKDEHSPEWWSDHIYTLLLTHSRSTDKILLSFDQFLDRPWLWVTDGATSNTHLYLGEKQVKTKFAAAVSLSHEELLHAVYTSLLPETVNIDIFVKPDERGLKRRLIANMDLGSYLVAAYIRYLIEYIDGSNPYWMTATTNAKLDLQVITLLRENYRAVPLDESQFDHHLSKNAWLGFTSALNQLFPDNLGVYLFGVLLTNSNYLDRESKQIGRWKKGMPSGLAITAIGNSLFNFVKQELINSPIHFALGDDVLLFNNNISLPQLSTYYQTFGAEVNTKKNWTSHNYAEYLHFLYSKHGRVGIPARIYGSLIYGLQFKDVTPIQRINELTTLFKDFFDRSCLPLNEDLVAADLSRSVSARWKGFSKDVAKLWLHIPKVVGGFGLIPYSYRVFKVVNDDKKITPYLGSKIKLPAKIEVTQSHFEISKFQFKFNNQYRLGRPIQLPDIETFQDWEDRINMKSSIYSSSLLSVGSEVIPLPEVPFVSTSRMSSFASYYKFNTFPNWSGNAVTRTNRLLNASLGLYQLVSAWLKKNNILVYV